MKTSNSFYVIQSANQADNGKLILTGQFIINGTTEVVSAPSSESRGTQPPVTIEIPRLFEAKWILPPRESWAYWPVKEFAERMEYETVEFDDFSYPQR